MPYRAIKTNIADSLNLIIQIERRPGRRVVVEMLEIRGYSQEVDQYNLREIYMRGRVALAFCFISRLPPDQEEESSRRKSEHPK
jgi:hypothetical protein